MTPRQKRNITLAKQRRIEKARDRYDRLHRGLEEYRAEVGRLLVGMLNGGAASDLPEWYGQSPQGVTVQ